MSTLYYMIGLPACGKTTEVKRRLFSDDDLICISKDALRPMLHSDRTWTISQELITNNAQKNLVIDMLNSGISVIIDDTNLNINRQQMWKDLASEHGHQSEPIDLRNVPVEVCIERDQNRDNSVGKDVIISMAKNAGLID